jgi:glycerol-3-phosphate dehydrogenase (NAD(P)+)
MASSFNHFGIIGAGAWGTALASNLLRAGRQVSLWAHESKVADAINHEHQNPYLKNIMLDPRLKATANLADMASCDAFIIACPAQYVRAVTTQLINLIKQLSAPIIVAAKGIELNTSALMSEVVAKAMPHHPLAVLSGPSFAGEVARGLPTALTFAIKDHGLGEAVVQAMVTPGFRLYLSDDVIGAEIGGAIKNVLAVACGIVTGKALGDNARAALITRGLAEMLRLGIALGARAETLMGLSGLGDLVLTCSSPQSRNMSLGIALGEGKKLTDILSARSEVTEGVTTAAAALALAHKHHVEMPIVAAVDTILSGRAPIEQVIVGLLARPLKAEGA